MAKHKPAPPPPPPAEAYTVLARRYRPQAFDELVGQEHIAQSLTNAIRYGRVAHAYLFTGARGVGKTSTARILARCLNCEKGPTVDPCGECSACKSIAAGEDVDVIEIDGASNNKVDEIRELRSNTQYRPARSRFKIYIIDEVHMLSTSAFNALLKTLEEPPPHVKFIFATTEAQKIPITILSRCQRFDFAGIEVSRIVERLRDIVKREGMKAEDEALTLIARRAGGSMRDAQSLLDQLLAFGSDTLTADQIHALLGTAGDDRVAEIADAVLQHDARKAIDLLRDLAQKTLQPGELLDQLISYWRDLMVANVAGNDAPDLGVPQRQRDTLIAQARAISLDTILAGLEVLNSARTRLKGTSQGRIVTEMALVRLARLDNLTSIGQLVQLLGQPRAEGTTPTSVRTAVPPEGVKKKLTEAVLNGEQQATVSFSAETIAQRWPYVFQHLPPFMVSNLEKSGVPAISGPNTLVLRFPLAYNGEKEYCQEPSRLERLETALLKLTGQTWRVRFETKEGEHTEQAIPTARLTEGESGMARSKRLREAAEQEPTIRRALEVLQAQVARVEEGFNSPVDGTVAPQVVTEDPEAEEPVEPEEA
jgi:DNA polymerase-3 subunit gamma/tau